MMSFKIRHVATFVGLWMAWHLGMGTRSLWCSYMMMAVAGMVEYGCSSRLVKTAILIYSLLHAKAKVNSYLFHKNTGITNEHISCDCIISDESYAGYFFFGSVILNWEPDIAGPAKHPFGCQTWIQTFRQYPDLCPCNRLVTHQYLMISVKRFSSQYVCLPCPYNPAHSEEQWCHCFVDSNSKACMG